MNNNRYYCLCRAFCFFFRICCSILHFASLSTNQPESVIYHSYEYEYESVIYTMFIVYTTHFLSKNCNGQCFFLHIDKSSQNWANWYTKPFEQSQGEMSRIFQIKTFEIALETNKMEKSGRKWICFKVGNSVYFPYPLILASSLHNLNYKILSA